jgi:hypothetical protein
MTHSPPVLRLSALLTGSVVLGEALALIVGLHILPAGDSPWLSRKNDTLLALDVATGLGLMLIPVLRREASHIPMLCVLTVVATVTHGYRTWEYLIGADNAFCANIPLCAVNNLKLLGTLTVASSALWWAAAHHR